LWEQGEITHPFSDQWGNKGFNRRTPKSKFHGLGGKEDYFRGGGIIHKKKLKKTPGPLEKVHDIFPSRGKIGGGRNPLTLEGFHAEIHHLQNKKRYPPEHPKSKNTRGQENMEVLGVSAMKLKGGGSHRGIRLLHQKKEDSFSQRKSISTGEKVFLEPLQIFHVIYFAPKKTGRKVRGTFSDPAG